MMKFAVTLFCTLLLVAAMVQAESATKRNLFAVEDEFGAARRGLFDNPGMDTAMGKGSKKSGKGGSSSGKSGKGGESSGKGSKKMASGKGSMDSGKGSKKMGKGGKGSKKDRIVDDFEDMVFGSMSM